MTLLTFGQVEGLSDTEYKLLDDLAYIYNTHAAANAKKTRYYEGHIPLQTVNLGIALPRSMRDVKIDCAWGGKAVDVLASRSMFDGFVTSNGDTAAEVGVIAKDNDLVVQYDRAVQDELLFGCSFATLSADPVSGVRIRFHSPDDAAAIWNGQGGRIAAGLAIIDNRRDESDIFWQPTVINLYTDQYIITLTRGEGSSWTATRYPHIMGRPLMEPMIWNATSAKPFGRSRLKSPIRGLIDGYVRTVTNATIGLEFSTTPQKYLLGISDAQYDALINQQFRAYIGNLFASTQNPETAQNPVFGQLAQGTIQPHIDMMRLLATQYAAATGLSVTDTGVVNDANPTSSDAVIAQEKTLISTAERLNRGNDAALQKIMTMALAVKRKCRLSDLTDEDRDIIAHFKNPAKPSVSTTADAAIKIASARVGFAYTDVFLEMVGFDQADIRRIKAQEAEDKAAYLDRTGQQPKTQGS